MEGRDHEAPRARHIAVDLLFYTGRRGGMETVVRSLYPRLAAEQPSWRFVALASRDLPASALQWFPGRVVSTGLSGSRRGQWAYGESLRVDRLALRIGADVLHCPANFGPIRTPAVPTVVTMHDALAYAHPQYLGFANALVQRRLASWTARHATRVVTVSHTAASDLTRFLGIPAGRLDVVSPGATRVPEIPAATRDLAGSGRTFVLSASNLMPHKNFAGLLRALATIPPHRRPRLVVTGGGAREELDALARELGLAEDVVILGWVSDDELELLYSRATAYVCPSLYEGFGLPVIDAMLRGVPVVCSDIPILREVGASAALYADASSPDRFASAITAVCEDDALRRRLITDGAARAAHYSWDETARGYARALLAAMHDDISRSEGER